MTSLPAEGSAVAERAAAPEVADIGAPFEGSASPAEHAWHSMRQLVLELHDKRAEVSAALGMSFTRVKMLRRLAHSPAAVPMRELAEALGTDAPYASVMVDGLQARGLVVRTPDPADRRVRLVAITAAGRDLAERADRLLDAPPAAMVALDDSDVRVLADVLAALVAASAAR